MRTDVEQDRRRTALKAITGFSDEVVALMSDDGMGTEKERKVERVNRLADDRLEEAARAIEATDFAGDEWSAKVFDQAKLTFAAKVRALKGAP